MAFSVLSCSSLQIFFEWEKLQFRNAYQKGHNVYAYFNMGNGLSASSWKEIETSTTKSTPFYQNEYCICIANRVPDSFWNLSKIYDKVHIISKKMLFATYKKEYNGKAHPRFVQSFVWLSLQKTVILLLSAKPSLERRFCFLNYEFFQHNPE